MRIFFFVIEILILRFCFVCSLILKFEVKLRVNFIILLYVTLSIFAAKIFLFVTPKTKKKKKKKYLFTNINSDKNKVELLILSGKLKISKHEHIFKR